MCAGDCCSGEITSITSTQGAVGDTPLIVAGTTTTLAAGEDATLTITGTAARPVLNFGIPQGDQGPAGRNSLGIINATAGSTLTESQSGSIVYLNNADAVAMILPANPAIGTYFIFRVSQSPVAGYTITCPSGHIYLGYYFAKKSVTADAIFAPNGTTNNVFSMNATTQGGLIGTDIMITYISAGRYSVSGHTYGSGVLITSFSG